MREDSFHSSRKLHSSLAITIAFLEEKLSQAREIISLANYGKIYVITSSGEANPPQDLSMVKVSGHSTFPIQKFM